MEHVISGLAEKPADAQRIIDELTTTCMCDRGDISLLGGDSASPAASAAGAVAGAAGATLHSVSRLLGDTTAFFTHQLSGFGPLHGVGRAGALLAKIALTSADDLAKGLSGIGIRQELARDYADALKRGSIVILVHARTERIAQCARQVMAAHGAAAAVHAAH